MNDSLLKAILSMDSYNRGYNAGIDLRARDSNGHLILDSSGNPIASDVVDTQLGNLKIYRSNGDSTAQADGFYAIAYQYTSGPYDGQVTISYRGTDQFLHGLDDTHDATTAGDILTAYGVGAGDADVAQSRLAIQFYQDVVEAVDPDLADPYLLALAGSVQVTGHSLGAGIAGLVGAIYGAQGDLFDNMGFKGAANSLLSYHGNQNPNNPIVPYTNWYPDPLGDDPSIYQLINGTNGPVISGSELDSRWQSGGEFAPIFDGLRATYVQGEVLSILPGGHNGQTDPTPESLDMHFTNSNVDMFDLHSVATLVIRMFANSGGPSDGVLPTDWYRSAPYFWPVMYNNQFAKDIGITDVTVSGRYTTESAHGADKALRTIIAYSAINEGTRVFGDTGIRALYDDANNLGEALGHQNFSQNMVAEATYISEAFVEFAGNLALRKVLQSAHPDATKGVLTLSDDKSMLTLSDDKSMLTVDFSEDLWKTGATVLPAMKAQQDLFKQTLEHTIVAPITVQNEMHVTWGNGTSTEISRAIFATADNGTEVLSNTTGTKATMFVGSGGNDLIKEGTGNNLIIGGGGVDTLDSSALTHDERDTLYMCALLSQRAMPGFLISRV